MGAFRPRMSLTMSYTPTPLDTRRLELPAELAPLVERLAANAHDVWAQTRLDQGWVWGPVRDDDRKHHPCLVAFEALPESEKEVDRVMVREAVKGILLLGYTVAPP